MTVTAFLQLISIISIGLFAGLMMSLIVILHRYWSSMEKATYIVEFKNFLIVAKGDRVVTFLTFSSFIVPFFLAFIEFLQGNTERGLYAFLAGGFFFLGVFLVTLILNLPLYNEVIAWEVQSENVGWKKVQTKFLFLNLIRFLSALIALILIILV